MRFPSPKLRSCWLTVYVLICLLKPRRNVPRYVWCLFFVLTRQNCASGIQMEPGGHCGCGYIPASLRTWIFWTVSNLTTPLAILKTISASSCQLQPYGLKISHCNYTTTSDPNQSLLDRHPYFLPVPVIIPFLFFGCTSWHAVLPWPGIKPVPLAVEGWRLNHWTTREAPIIILDKQVM